MSELIPVKDLNNVNPLDEVLAKARPEAVELIQKAEQFALVAINPLDADGNQTIEASIGATDHGLMTMVVTLLGIIGAGELGEALERMPPAVARASAEMVGYQNLNRFLQARGERALQEAEAGKAAAEATPSTH